MKNVKNTISHFDNAGINEVANMIGGVLVSANNTYPGMVRIQNRKNKKGEFGIAVWISGFQIENDLMVPVVAKTATVAEGK